MKVIDLLNKISKGEEVPGRIIFENYTYWYEECNKNYYMYSNKDLDDEDIIYLFDQDIAEILNDEVEIIENTLEYNKEIKNLQKRIDKAIRYIEPKMICEYIHTDYINNMIKLLKGEENE